MSVHHFETRVAEKVGIPAAVIAYAIRYWCDHKAANEKDIHDGKAWVYNSVKAWAELLPYMSEKQIRTAIKKLEDAGIIESRNLNLKQYDQTRWYAYNGLQTVINITNCPNGQMELPKKANAIAQMGNSNCPKGQTNTNNIPNNIPNEKTVRFEDAWKLYRSCKLKARQTRKLAEAQWPKAIKKADPEIIMSAIKREVEDRNNPSGFIASLPDMHRWLRDERWQDVEAETPEQPKSLEDWKQAAANYCELQVWPAPLGPPPHQAGCKAPTGLLKSIAKKMQGHTWHRQILDNIGEAA